MFSAEHFTYDGVYSGIYGVVIGDFDDNSVVETESFSAQLKTFKPRNSPRFYYNGISYEDTVSIPISLISQEEVTEEKRRELFSWLIGRNSFKPLIIHQDGLEVYTYRCIFINASNIYVNGTCHGIKATAVFDSPYAYGEPTIITLQAGNHLNVHMMNYSDVQDGYAYPIIQFTGANLSITNLTDDSNRVFELKNLPSASTTTIDNELRYLDNPADSRIIQKFNKNWLRLRKGDNVLNIVCDGSVTIECPNYVMIGI